MICAVICVFLNTNLIAQEAKGYKFLTINSFGFCAIKYLTLILKVYKSCNTNFHKRHFYKRK